MTRVQNCTSLLGVVDVFEAVAFNDRAEILVIEVRGASRVGSPVLLARVEIPIPSSFLFIDVRG